MAATITVVIHTHNEQDTIEPCIASARLLTRDILVVDMESTDGTRELARKNHVPIVKTLYRTYVEPARAFGIRQAKTDWVFILDADERLTPQLAKEIKEILNHPGPTNVGPPLLNKEGNQREGLDNQPLQAIRYPLSPQFTHYKIPRKNIFGKKHWLRHGGWWPDHQIRLINRTAFQDWPDRIHSAPDIEGTMGYLKNPFIHEFHGDIAGMVEKTTIYENIEAELLHTAGREVQTSTFFRKFFGELFRRLVRHQGFRDGRAGIIESIYQAYSKTITYLYLYEKKKGSAL